MPRSKGALVIAGIGVVMIGLGAWIAAAPLVRSGHPVTGNRILDVAFALFFVLRGLMNVRKGLRTPG